MNDTDNAPPSATLTFTRVELDLIRRVFISRADVHPCDWPANKDAARGILARLDAARHPCETGPS